MNNTDQDESGSPVSWPWHFKMAVRVMRIVTRA